MSELDQPRRRGRWVKIALVISLCVNVLVIGAVGGFFWKHRGYEGGRFRLHSIVRALPEEKRTAAREALEAKLPEYEALREQIREARRESTRLMSADPLDEAALRASVQRARVLSAERRVMVEDALLNFTSTLSAEERKAVAEHLSRGRDRRDRWRKSRRKD